MNTTSMTLFRSVLPNAEKYLVGSGQTGMIRTMADFSKAAYNLTHTGANEDATINDTNLHATEAYDSIINHNNWTPVTFASLPLVLSGGVLQSGMLNDGFYIANNAAALVARCGDAIVLSFRGTNDNDKNGVINPNDPNNTVHPDVDQWKNMPDHYDLLIPFLNAFDTYVANRGIDKVYVTGHSMGGAMALEYMSHHLGSKYQAVTFGASPFGEPYIDVFGVTAGTERKDYAPDSRITQIEIAKDPAPMGFDIKNVLGDITSRPGHTINFAGDKTQSMPDLQKVPWVDNYYGRTANHSMDYYRQITDSVDVNSWTKILAGTASQSVLLGVRPQGTNFIVDGQLSGTNASVEKGNNILASSDFNVLYGGKGSDTLTSGASDTILLGGSGSDWLRGQAGDDTLSGGLGKDSLTGGVGADSFMFDRVAETGVNVTDRDIVSDFKHDQGDKIDLSAIDANTVMVGNNAFDTLIVGNHFSGGFASRGDLYFDNVMHILYGNNDADSSADFAIGLMGITTLNKADFIV